MWARHDLRTRDTGMRTAGGSLESRESRESKIGSKIEDLTILYLYCTSTTMMRIVRTVLGLLVHAGFWRIHQTTD
jgi:hypothetical protein